MNKVSQTINIVLMIFIPYALYPMLSSQRLLLLASRAPQSLNDQKKYSARMQAYESILDELERQHKEIVISKSKDETPLYDNAHMAYSAGWISCLNHDNLLSHVNDRDGDTSY